MVQRTQDKVLAVWELGIQGRSAFLSQLVQIGTRVPGRGAVEKINRRRLTLECGSSATAIKYGSLTAAIQIEGGIEMATKTVRDIIKIDEEKLIMGRPLTVASTAEIGTIV